MTSIEAPEFNFLPLHLSLEGHTALPKGTEDANKPVCSIIKDARPWAGASSKLAMTALSGLKARICGVSALLLSSQDKTQRMAAK
ncbi:hypothetical protein GOB15_29650 [Sinorhizobium meliloti]|nr:hypothetical protein [Sinorhizobium meliloti]MDW9514621.1 hypothetical protein [Sinorhizobium meliloti]